MLFYFLLLEKEWYSRMCLVKNFVCRIDIFFICCLFDLVVIKFLDEGFLIMFIVFICMSILWYIDFYEVLKIKEKWNFNKIMLLDIRNKIMVFDCMSICFELEMKVVLL